MKTSHTPRSEPPKTLLAPFYRGATCGGLCVPTWLQPPVTQWKPNPGAAGKGFVGVIDGHHSVTSPRRKTPHPCTAASAGALEIQSALPGGLPYGF